MFGQWFDTKDVDEVADAIVVFTSSPDRLREYADDEGHARYVTEDLVPFVERTFPLHSPTIQKVDVVRSARVRRAKLYFLRDLKGKAARMKETVRRPA